MCEGKTENEVKRKTGLTLSQFKDLLASLPTFQSRNQSKALYIFLVKLRTGQTNEVIADEFHLTATTVGRILSRVRMVLIQHFAHKHVNYLRSHEDLVLHNTTMCRELFCKDDVNRVVLICDGTYLFTNKSRNYEFQKQTYTSQKKRNFIKVMMCVASDGCIVFLMGPYPARDNDAKILRAIFDTSTAFDNLREGDVLMLDRGFRDCVKFIEEKGLQVKMPSLVQKSKKKGQLSTIDANLSRLVTATRFVVETRNGHLKNVWKLFNKDWNPLEVPHLIDDLLIAAALINKYFVTFEPNKEIANDIARRMLERVNVPNKLAKVVKKASFQKELKSFEPFENFQMLPTLTEIDLVHISLGKYQIKQAASYVQEHLKEHRPQTGIFCCPDDVLHQFFTEFISSDKELLLLLMQIKSRHRSKQFYNTFVLLDICGLEENAVLEYCCDCYVGLRTVGCCSHVMCIIWLTLFVKDMNTPKPAEFLNTFFNTINTVPGDDDNSDEEDNNSDEDEN